MQRILVETQIGDQFLEPRVLIAQLFGFLYFAGLHTAILRLPCINRVNTHSHFPRNVGCTSACIHLF